MAGPEHNAICQAWIIWYLFNNSPPLHLHPPLHPSLHPPLHPSLGIMGDLLRASLTSFSSILCCNIPFFLWVWWGAVNSSPMMQRDLSLSDSCTSDPCCFSMRAAHRNLSEILLNQTKIRLYLPFPGWFRSKRISVWFQIYRNMVNTIWFPVNLIRFLCVWAR